MVTRKKFGLFALAMLALGGVAVAGDREVINLTTAGGVVAGSPLAASVSVNAAPMSVTFTSNPPGLVNYTTTVTSTSQTVAVPTSASASGSYYTVTATPTSGGGSKSAGVAVSPDL